MRRGNQNVTRIDQRPCYKFRRPPSITNGICRIEFHSQDGNICTFRMIIVIDFAEKAIKFKKI